MLFPRKVIFASESYARISQQGISMKIDYSGIDYKVDAAFSVLFGPCYLDYKQLCGTVHKSFITSVALVSASATFIPGLPCFELSDVLI